MARGGACAVSPEELCVCENLTGSKWRRLLQRILLCEGNNTPPQQQRRQRRVAEHLSSSWACRSCFSPGQGALLVEGQRPGAHPPESLLCDWGVAGGWGDRPAARSPGLGDDAKAAGGPQSEHFAAPAPSAPRGRGPRSGGPGGAGSVGRVDLS